MFRILLVDDYKEWRRQVGLLLPLLSEAIVIYEASDGSEAVQRAQELKPHLVLLDIGLPMLNGIEAARQIRLVSPNSKILFLSQDNSVDTLQAAMNTGAEGYVHKAHAGRELLAAVEAVLRGEQFISSSLKNEFSAEAR